jgi:hypothetical protein
MTAIVWAPINEGVRAKQHLMSADLLDELEHDF